MRQFKAVRRKTCRPADERMIGGRGRGDFSTIEALRVRNVWASENRARNEPPFLVKNADALSGQIATSRTLGTDLEAHLVSADDRRGNIPDGETRLVSFRLERESSRGLSEERSRYILRRQDDAPGEFAL